MQIISNIIKIMKWKIPPKIKIYEALGCIADERIELSGSEAKVYSSSKNKFYTITYDKDKNAIMSNDNASYWKGELGYPSIAFLMIKEITPYNNNFAEILKDITWKDINQKFNNNYEKTLNEVKEIVTKRGFSFEELEKEIEKIHTQIIFLGINLLGEKTKPPEGY